MNLDELPIKAFPEEFAACIRRHRVWSELRGYFNEFTNKAFREFIEFPEDDAAKLMALRARWMARKDFQADIEAHVAHYAGLQEEIKEEYQAQGKDPAELDDYGSINE